MQGGRQLVLVCRGMPPPLHTKSIAPTTPHPAGIAIPATFPQGKASLRWVGTLTISNRTPPQSRRCRDSSPYTGEPSPRRKLVLTGKAFPLVFRHAKPRSKRWLAPGWVFYDTFGLLPFSGLVRFPAWEICNTARCGNFRFYRICTPSGRKVRAQVSPTR